MKSTLSTLFRRLRRPCTLQRALKAARLHVLAGREPAITLIEDPSAVIAYLPGKGVAPDDCWFFRVAEQPLPGGGLPVGASRVLCLRKKDCALVFDGFCGE